MLVAWRACAKWELISGFAVAIGSLLSFVVVGDDDDDDICVSSSRWSGVVPTFYPQFSDGWRYPGVNMDDIGLSVARPPASTQQVSAVYIGVVYFHRLYTIM